MNTRTVTICAFTVALLIAVQFGFSFVAGVELVTVLFVSFCYVFGARRGLITATAFSLARCIIFGFYPNVVILYLIYYSLLALAVGSLGRNGKVAEKITPIMLLLLAAACAYFAVVGIPISVLYKEKISAMLWVLCGLSISIALAHTVLCLTKRFDSAKEVSTVTSVAVCFTVLFTLLDDVLTPLLYGYGVDTAIAYFYTSFLALLPQTICVAVSVFALFYPFKNAMRTFCRDTADGRLRRDDIEPVG